MRKLLLSLFAAAACTAATAQTQVVRFEDSLTLPTTDTFFITYAQPGQDVGFSVGWTHFPCVFDTIFGGIWDHGTTYSNMADSATSGAGNQYAAKTLKGYNNSAMYGVMWCSQYGTAPARITYPTYKPDTTMGFYITNSTFAYNSMRDGDMFAKKFGGVTGNDSDYFYVTIKGYYNGVKKADSVNVYLADFRDPNNANDYILKTWQWVDLRVFNRVDSFEFTMTSSDTSGGYANTPTYICIDNWTSTILPIHVNEVPSAFAARVFPNPATDNLFVELVDQTVTQFNVYDVAGKLVLTQQASGRDNKINTSSLQPGTYFLSLQGAQRTASMRFIKQ